MDAPSVALMEHLSPSPVRGTEKPGIFVPWSIPDHPNLPDHHADGRKQPGKEVMPRHPADFSDPGPGPLGPRNFETPSVPPEPEKRCQRPRARF